jgi:prophage tail gpP-like protein
MPAKSSERARLTVKGQQFEDFESVWVQHTFGDAYSQFKFEFTERASKEAQFSPDDEAQVQLAGELAISGRILTRQVAYDGHRHGVMVHGVNNTWYAARSSIEHKTSSWDGKSFKQIADEVLGPTGVKSEVQGTLDDKPFDKVQSVPGEPIFNFLERLARERNIGITCTKDGNFLFVGKNSGSGSQGQLIEGRNILKMQGVISIDRQWSKIIARAQYPADNRKNMKPAARMEKEAEGVLKKYSVLIVQNEHPVRTEDEVQTRVNTEAEWTRSTQLQLTITVVGWQPGGPTGGGGLWEVGKKVSVNSPMVPIADSLSIQSATFTQDNKHGSLTTLLCVAPWNMKQTSKIQAPTSLPPPSSSKK